MTGVALLLAVLAGTQEPPRFESATDIVAIDATVVDDRGSPVTDLRPEDFAISVDGRQRSVAFAEYHGFGRQPAASAGRHFSSNEGAVGGRLVALVVDQASLAPGAARQILSGARALLERLTAADRSTLITLPQGSGPQVDFTPDHARLEKALERVAGQVGTGPRTRVGIGDALAMTRGDVFAAEEVFNRECAFLRGPSRDQCENEVRADAVSVAAQARQQAAQSVQGLRAVIEQLKRIEGPKTMVLVAQSLLEEEPGEVRTLAEVAASARILLFVVLAGSDSPDASVSRMMVASAADRRMQLGGLEDLSSLLGGVVLRISGGSDAAFARIGSEISGRYSLGFEPQPRERDGRAHKLRVQSHRAGVVVHARSVLALPALGPPQTKEHALMATLQRPDLAVELPLRVATYTVRDLDQSKIRVLVSAEIGQAGLPAPSDLSLGFVLLDGSGRVASGGFDTLADSPGDGPARFVGAAAVPPGAYLLKLAARDGHGRLGSVEHPVQAALTDAGELSVSDLILSGGEALTLRPSVDPELRGDGCLAYLELYGRAPQSLDAASVALEVAGSEGGPALLSVAAPVLAGAAADRRVAQATVPLDQLPAGAYIARAIVSVSGQTVRRVTQPFRVAR